MTTLSIPPNAGPDRSTSTISSISKTVAIELAAKWYRSHRDTAVRPLVPTLNGKFGLTASEAAKALDIAHRRIGGGHG